MTGIHHVLVGHVLRRSIDMYSPGDMSPLKASNEPNTTVPLPGDDGNTHQIDISLPALITIGLTLLFAVVFITSLRYTLWSVVTTLTAVEEPQTVLEVQGAVKPVGSVDTADIEVAQVKQTAITSSVRATIRHLTSRAGWLSRWRGLSLFVCYMLAYSSFQGLVMGILGRGIVGEILGNLVAYIALARWSTAWVHIVISEPSQKFWFRRIPGWKTVRNVALPILVSCVADRIVMLSIYGMTVLVDASYTQSPMALLGKFLGLFAVALTLFVTVSLPASVALIRVQASMLPEEDESIVPFDRSFGGKVKPAITGGSGALSLRDALTSFDKPSRNRMVRMIAKLVGIEIGMNLFFGIIVALELLLFIGSDGIKEIPKNLSY